MSILVIIFGLLSGCFLSVLVGLVGRNRNIGFGWAFILSLLLTPLVGLLITLISSRTSRPQSNWGCIGYVLGFLGLIFLIIFLLAIMGVLALF